ncbi:Uma2 family endonuclease [Synechococcales cyanobacterium C]|uniref:Uma2 family endonuclease n=1 Tax=Petrachloros mirabilis ULC683 TaxID=2781853 RepID=A0A8K1ZYF0_9CYAN|nr:Uma2 family endonuclease [Petrachloros mirabilis]NCJ06218.1 Uma2 family endonuclease [Petrachloros mirabilis ULC683]
MVTTIPLQIPKTLRVSDEQFLEFVKANPELRLERTASGELIAMPPTGSESGFYNSELNVDVGLWNRQQHSGKIFDSSSGFRLPNGAIRSPDVSWVSQTRWDALTPKQRQGFAPLCPDFVVELVSKTDTLAEVQAKMVEYQENGCRLGWLINPKTRTVEIYRPDRPVATVAFSEPLSGENILPGFELNLQTIFGAEEE